MKNKLYIIIIVVLAICVLGLGGFTIYNYFTNRNNEKCNCVSETNKTSECPKCNCPNEEEIDEHVNVDIIDGTSEITHVENIIMDPTKLKIGGHATKKIKYSDITDGVLGKEKRTINGIVFDLDCSTFYDKHFDYDELACSISIFDNYYGVVYGSGCMTYIEGYLYNDALIIQYNTCEGITSYFDYYELKNNIGTKKYTSPGLFTDIVNDNLYYSSYPPLYGLEGYFFSYYNLTKQVSEIIKITNKYPEE